MKLSVTELRRGFGKVLDALNRSESITLTYRGQSIALIVPKATKPKVHITNHPAFGMWKDRAGIKDVEGVVRRLRKGRFSN